jgi:hypothetical protein
MSKRKQPTTRSRWVVVDDGHDGRCGDCGTDTIESGEFYMVHDALWAQAQSAGRPCDLLCVGCIEARIGRRLRANDFNAAPLNGFAACGRSARLRARLRGWNRLLTEEDRRVVVAFLESVIEDARQHHPEVDR